MKLDFDVYQKYVEGMVLRGLERATIVSDWRAHEDYRLFQRLADVGMYEDPFRDLFIERMIKPNFSHHRSEAELFDLIAYRTNEDAKDDVNHWVWRHYEENGIESPVVQRHLREHGLTELPRPPPFPGHDQLYGFEFKTNADDPWRFLTQLPRYCWFFDAVVLVLGDRVKRPPRLPEWVDVMKYDPGVDTFIFERRATYRHRSMFGRSSVQFAKWYQPKKGQTFDYSNSPGWGDYISFMRRLAVNSVFHADVIPYTIFDHALLEYLRRVRGIEKRQHSQEVTEEARGLVDEAVKKQLGLDPFVSEE